MTEVTGWHDDALALDAKLRGEDPGLSRRARARVIAGELGRPEATVHTLLRRREARAADGTEPEAELPPAVRPELPAELQEAIDEARAILANGKLPRIGVGEGPDGRPGFIVREDREPRSPDDGLPPGWNYYAGPAEPEGGKLYLGLRTAFPGPAGVVASGPITDRLAAVSGAEWARGAGDGTGKPATAPDGLELPDDPDSVADRLDGAGQITGLYERAEDPAFRPPEPPSPAVFVPPYAQGPAMIVPDSMRYEVWEGLVHGLNKLGQYYPWYIADLMEAGERLYGSMYSQVMGDTNYSYQTLANWRSVARAFPPLYRRPMLSFKHHALVRPLVQDNDRSAAEELLDWCEQPFDDGLERPRSTAELAAEIAARRRGRPRPRDGEAEGGEREAPGREAGPELRRVEELLAVGRGAVEALAGFPADPPALCRSLAGEAEALGRPLDGSVLYWLSIWTRRLAEAASAASEEAAERLAGDDLPGGDDRR